MTFHVQLTEMTSQGLGLELDKGIGIETIRNSPMASPYLHNKQTEIFSIDINVEKCKRIYKDLGVI